MVGIVIDKSLIVVPSIVVFQKTKEVKAEEANFTKLKEEVKKDYINRQVGEYMSKLF